MKLHYEKRVAAKKSESKQLRRAGRIPAVIYSLGKEGESLSVCSSEFETLQRQVPKGRLSTTVFTLSDGAHQRKAILKEIQYDPTSYRIIALDFEELHPNTPISLRVPIEFSGVVECQGTKLGGVLRQVIRQVRVRCQPEQIPASFVLDVRHLGLKQTLRLSDIKWPEGVHPVANLEEVAVVVAKR